MEKPKEATWQGIWDRIEPFLSKDWSSHLQMVGLTLLLLTIQIWQISGYGRLSLSVFLAGIVCLCEASSTATRFKQNLQRQFQRNTMILLALEIISMLFLLVSSRDIIEVIGIGGEVLLVFGLAAAIGAQIVQLRLTEYRWKPGKDAVKECILLGVLCLVIGFLLNIEIFNTWLRWDSYHYFHAFEVTSAKNIFFPMTNGGLNICGHISIAYALYTLFFLILPHITHENAMYLSQMVLVAVDLILIYNIFKKILVINKFYIRVLYTLTVICSPWILGRVSDLSPELTVLTGVLLLLNAIFSKNYLLCILAAFISCTSRETGVVVAATIIFVQLIYELTGKSKKEAFKSVNWVYFVNCFLIGILWLIEYRISNWSDGSTTETRLIDGTLLNQISFSPLHIKNIIIYSLIVSFGWIFTLFILLTTIVFIVRLAQKKETISRLFVKRPFWFVFIGLVSSLIVMSIFVACYHFRYYTVPAVLLCILGLCCIHYIFNTVLNLKMIADAFSLILYILLLVESYMTIDPVTLSVCPVINTGSTVIASMQQYTENYKDPTFTDDAYGNRQVVYFDKALDQAYTSIYDRVGVRNTEILFSGEYKFSSWGGSLYQIWGFGYAFRDPPMWSHWNDKGCYRYLSYEQTNNIDPSYVNADTDLSNYLNNYEHVYYIKMPWGDTVLEPLMERYPDISFFQTIEYRGWVLEIYRVE